MAVACVLGAVGAWHIFRAAGLLLRVAYSVSGQALLLGAWPGPLVWSILCTAGGPVAWHVLGTVGGACSVSVRACCVCVGAW